MLEFLSFLGIGFLAQIVDGALGMAYGVISMGILISMGIPPSAGSAAVHTAEIFTTGVSGFSHAMFKNIDYRLFRRLIVPGIVGSIVGAYLLTILPVKIIKPIIATYLLVMGFVILYKVTREVPWVNEIRQLVNKALNREKPSHHLRRVLPLGLVGGFCDAIGGGGWGSVVTSTLLAQDDSEPRYTIGSTNLAEFLVTLSSSMTFFALIGISHWQIVIGLLLGGIIAAPVAAFSVRYLPGKYIMRVAGILVILVSLNTIVRLFL